MVAASDFSYFFLLFAQIVVILHAVQLILRHKTRKIICQNIMGFLSKLFGKKQDEKSYVKAFQAFINIVPILKVRWTTIEKAYYKKLGENYHRQDTNY